MSVSSDEDLVAFPVAEAGISTKGERLLRVESLLLQLQPRLECARRCLREAERAPHALDRMTSCAQAVRELQQLEVALQKETNVTKPDPHIALIVRRWKQLQSVAKQQQQQQQPVDPRSKHQLHSASVEHSSTELHSTMRALASWLDEAQSVQSRQTRTPDSLAQLQAAALAHTVTESGPLHVQCTCAMLHVRYMLLQCF